MTNPAMNCDLLDEQLAEYLEETLDSGTRDALESHATVCARCGALLADLRAIARDAAALPALTPSRDLWSGISQSIETPVVPVDVFSLQRARRLSLIPWLTAAAAALVLATSGVTYVVTREAMMERAAPSGEGPAVAAAPIGGVTRNISESDTYESTYDAEIVRLRTIVRERRGDLDSAVVAEIERNLTIIDRAIAESRAALARDPASGFLNDQLMSSLDKKVELLRTVALLPVRT